MPATNHPFIDAHCHLFNILDVPLFESLSGKITQGTINRLLLAFAAGPAVVLGAPQQVLTKYQSFINFFENDIRGNIIWLEKQLNLAINDNLVKGYLGNPVTRLVITPLVMDFDTNLTAGNAESDYKRCVHQIERLFVALNAYNSDITGNGNIKLEIYPFMGFALDKLNHANDCLEVLMSWWDAHGLSAEERYSGYTQCIPFGKAIGIKLYPPLGFNPCPQDHPEAYLDFYNWCIEKDIPLSVHCQKSSFCTTQQQILCADEFTHPRNWERLIDTFPYLQQLRINFGHFGGEFQIASLVKFGDNTSPVRLNEDSWSSSIFRLLRKCPHTYADLAAFNYSQYNCLEQLGLLLGGYADSLPGFGDISQVLRRKLIWGTDVPMIISTDAFIENGIPSYAKPLKSFILSNPDASSQGDYKNIVSAVTRVNPSDFLFGK
jgi:hypothetical protein